MSGTDGGAKTEAGDGEAGTVKQSNSLQGADSAFEYAPVMMCVLGRDRRVLRANRAFREFTGAGEEELSRGCACGVFGCINARDDERGCGFGPRCADCALLKAIQDTLATDQEHRHVEYRAILERAGKRQEVVFLGSTVSLAAAGKGEVLLCLQDVGRQVMAEDEREATVRLLGLLNDGRSNLHELVHVVLTFLRDWSGCEAVGIRLQEGDDFPYVETHGFPAAFVQAENRLCVPDLDGQVERDGVGNPILECMCGNILRGRFDPSKPFFTPHGSFWSNGTTKLLANTSEADRQARTRNRCNGEGYESVALVPLRVGQATFGLMQFNDKRPDRFTPESIALLERLGDSIAIALAHRKAELELRESERKYRDMVENLNDAVIGTDVTGMLTFVSPVIQRILAREPATILGRHFSEFVLPEDLPVAQRVFSDLVMGRGGVAEFRMLTAAGEPRWVNFSGRPLWVQGLFGGVQGRLTDVTARREVEEALRESEATIRGVFRAAPVGVCTMKGRVFQSVNEFWCSMLGYQKAGVLGRTTRLLYESDEEYERVGRELYARPLGAGVASTESRLRCSDGSFRDAVVTAALIQPDAPEVGSVVIVHDITDRKAAERRQVEQLDELRRWQGLMLGRESRVIELKKEVNDLLVKFGQPPKYPSAAVSE